MQMMPVKHSKYGKVMDYLQGDCAANFRIFFLVVVTRLLKLLL